MDLSGKAWGGDLEDTWEGGGDPGTASGKFSESSVTTDHPRIQHALVFRTSSSAKAALRSYI